MPPENSEYSTSKPVAPDASIHTTGNASSDALLDDDTANAVQAPQTGKSVAKASAGIGVLHLLRLLLGIISKPIIANRLGLSASADVYTIATDIVSSLWRIFEKAVNPTFLPCFMSALNETDDRNADEQRAWKFASTSLFLTVLFLLILWPVAWFFMPQIVNLYSDKADAAQRVLTVSVARLLLSGLLFLGVSSLTYVILNGYKRFAWAALGDAFWKAGVLIGAAYAMARKLSPEASLNALSWGFVIGAFLKLLPHLLAIGRKWKMLRPQIDWHDPLLKKMLLLALPLLIGIFVSESRDIYIRRLADNPSIQIEGSRAALNFSSTIGSSLIQIFPYALSIGIFPYLADMARAKDKQPLTDTLMGALRVCVFVFAPLTAILIALHGPLLRAVWESGQLSRADTLVMSLPFIAYTLGLIGFSCEMMINQTFYAMTNVWRPTIVGLFTTVIWIAIATWGVQAGWGLAAIAGAEAFSKSFKCVVMWIWLRRDLGEVNVRHHILFTLRVLIASLLAAALAWFLARYIVPTSEVMSRGDKIKMLLAVCFAGAGGMAVYLVATLLSGLDEARAMGTFLGKIRARFAR